MMSAYVKWMETAGARVVPLIMGEMVETTFAKMSKMNGILFPGGDGDYYLFGQPIYDEILKRNDEGEFYPAWGTCLGIEALAQWASDEGEDVLGSFEALHVALPLEFLEDPSDTKMFSSLGQSAFLFETTAMTTNIHSYAVDPSKFETDKGLKSMFKPTSVSYTTDGQNLAFTATMESEKYPIFGTQFHPESTMSMFYDDSNVNHSWESIKMNRHFLDYFMTLARQNTNTFGDFSETQKYIVQNYDMIVTDSHYEAVYVFDSGSLLDF